VNIINLIAESAHGAQTSANDTQPEFPTTMKFLRSFGEVIVIVSDWAEIGSGFSVYADSLCLVFVAGILEIVDVVRDWHGTVLDFTFIVCSTTTRHLSVRHHAVPSDSADPVPDGCRGG